jgi:uncharacterized membrane protein YhaH (DUF805 family)
MPDGAKEQSVDWVYLLVSFEGRISRQPFWIAFLTVAAMELTCHLSTYQFADGERLSAIVSLAFAYPEFAVFAKRGHDRNIPPRVIGAFFLLSVTMDFLVVIGLGGARDAPSALLVVLGVPWMLFAAALLIELGMRPGTVGPNRYGPDPLV